MTVNVAAPSCQVNGSLVFQIACKKHTCIFPILHTYPSAHVPEWHAQDVSVLRAVDALNALIAGGAHGL